MATRCARWLQLVEDHPELGINFNADPGLLGAALKTMIAEFLEGVSILMGARNRLDH